MPDIKVSWLQFDTQAVPCEVKVSWLQFDTNAAPCDVKVSWLAFDTNVSTPAFASLGAATERQRRKPKPDKEAEITEAIGAEAVSRLRNEFMAESLTQDVINRARKRKSRAEEEALLLMI